MSAPERRREKADAYPCHPARNGHEAQPFVRGALRISDGMMVRIFRATRKRRHDKIIILVFLCANGGVMGEEA